MNWMDSVITIAFIFLFRSLVSLASWVYVIIEQCSWGCHKRIFSSSVLLQYSPTFDPDLFGSPVLYTTIQLLLKSKRPSFYLTYYLFLLGLFLWRIFLVYRPYPLIDKIWSGLLTIILDCINFSIFHPMPTRNSDSRWTFWSRPLLVKYNTI